MEALRDMLESPARRIFISYSSAHSDSDWVGRVGDALAEHGLRASLNVNDAGSGERWRQQVEEKLRNSDALLFILSGDEAERPNMFFELGFAKALGKRAIFVIPGNHDISWIPYDLRDEEVVTRKSPDATAQAVAATLTESAGAALPTEAELPDASRNQILPVGSGDSVEFASNPEPRVPCLLVIDTSGSMSGQPIEELNAAVTVLRRSLKDDELARRRIDLGIVTFSGNTQLALSFSSPDDAATVNLHASGTTATGSALKYALQLLQQRKRAYREEGIPYHRPWMVLITDGVPTDDWREAADDVRAADAKGELLFLAVGVEGADMDTLARIAPQDRPPLKLRELEFKTLFRWLLMSLKEATLTKVGDRASLPPVDWASNR
jgi:uncharacterized protein YegL